jgi:ubiquinone/menaquinone biosynthesis C-methylase UbiE
MDKKLFSLDATNYNETISYEDVYWDSHPRFIYFKSLPDNAKLLDLGAGPGNLIWWKNRGIVKRSDLHLYAIDLVESEQFSKYDGYKIYNLEDTKRIDYADSFFDAAFCSHILEHLQSMPLIISELHRVLNDNGLLYIEIPTPLTLNYPRKEDIMKDPDLRKIFSDFIVSGDNNTESIQASILSFWDDETHHKTYSQDEMVKLLKEHNFFVVSSGVIENPYLENKLIAQGILKGSSMHVLLGLWLKYKFSQFFVCKKINK